MGATAGLRPETLVCVDFDDTLVANQEHFEAALRQLVQALTELPGVSAAAARAAFERLDAQQHGHDRHRNRFLQTVVATYCAVAGTDAVPLQWLPRLAGLAALPYDAPPRPVPGAAEALERLRRRHPGPLWLVTTGDPVVQAGRIQRSGLAGRFDALHILPRKDVAAFAALGAGRSRPWMIGNSPATDVLPALAAGFAVLHVTAATWALDVAAVPPEVPRCPSFPAAVDHLLSEAAP